MTEWSGALAMATDWPAGAPDEIPAKLRRIALQINRPNRFYKN